MRLHPALALTALALASFLTSTAHAGQVRIDVNFRSFSPTPMSLNLGDHAVWVFVEDDAHTVTSGTDGSLAGDGKFRTNTLLYTAADGAGFSWKSNVTGSVPFYCRPHFTMNMKGSLTVATSGIAVSDFRITEIQYNRANGADLIEITNMGDAAGDFGRYRFAVATSSSTIDTATVPMDRFTVAAGARFTVHANASGLQSAADLYLPTLAELPATGSLALYVPNTATLNSANAIGNVTNIIDFIQWGAAGQPDEATAQAASPVLWTTGEFLSPVRSGHSYEFCGARADRGATHWSEVSVPNFGVDDHCATPTMPTTWGRLKVLYR